jgi:CRISPR/Cas system-associated exonuclease Cas4 (RecB family)
LLTLDRGLRRSLLTRWARWKHPWSKYDGLYDLDDDTIAMLAAHRLDARPYSVSSLQRFAVCPYQFLLAAVYRLVPRQEVEPLEKLDPLTRGRMVHEVQAEFMRELKRTAALPLTATRVADAEAVLDDVLDRVSAAYAEQLAPAIDRVWRDEVEAVRADLKGWIHHVANEDGEWIPIRAEFGFGFALGGGRDPESVPDPVTLDGRWRLHGVVDLIEAKAGPTPHGELRVTDHKTGKNRTRERMVVGRGEVLQPVLYGLSVEQALGRAVGESQLFFCTSTGGFARRPVTLGERERRSGIEVLEIIDRAVESGMFLPAPREGACRWCDYREVCGPWEERRARRVKDETKLVDLYALRGLP